MLKNYGWTDRPPEDNEIDRKLKVVYFPIEAKDSEEWRKMVNADLGG
jgi:hypothetical protein